jgi:hypothetical protein
MWVVEDDTDVASVFGMILEQAVSMSRRTWRGRPSLLEKKRRMRWCWTSCCRIWTA